MPGDPTKREKVDEWTRPASVKPGFVVDLLTATSRIDAGLAARAIERLLAWPKTYGPDDVLTPAALALVKLPESKSWPAAARLRQASLDHLQRRIALPLEAPRGLDQGQPARLPMRRLPCARRLPGSAGSTAVAAEGGPGSTDPCRAKRAARGVRPRSHDRKAGQPPRACRHQESGQLPAARKAAPSGSRACSGAGRMRQRRPEQRDRAWHEPDEQGSPCRSCRQGR